MHVCKHSAVYERVDNGLNPDETAEQTYLDLNCFDRPHVNFLLMKILILFHVNNKGTDHPVHPPSLMSTFDIQ